LSPADHALVQAYLRHVTVEKRLAARTVALYTLDLEKLAAHTVAAQVPLTAVQGHHIRGWVARMHAGGRTGRGIALILSGWRGFYTWAGRYGHVSHNPVVGVRAPKSPKPLPKALGVDDAVRLAGLQRPGADPVREARDRCMVELLYGSGLRLGELLGLNTTGADAQRGWVDVQAAEAHVVGKGSKRRTVPVGAVAVAALQAWLAARGTWMGAKPLAANANDEPPFAALFTSRQGRRLSAQQVRVVLRQRGVGAGLAAPVHPHMLRHSFASHVLQSSGDLRAVQELLGHANIATTQVYTRLDFQHLAKAYDAAHPRAKRLSPGDDEPPAGAPSDPAGGR
jgi:integrase/recombinase XerC